jgi:predicted nucleic acid-binding protein
VDTSVLAAYYCPEPLSETAEEILTACEIPVISHLTTVEIASAVSRKIRQRELSLNDGNKIINQFQLHLTEQQLYRLLPVEQRHYQMARNWIVQFNASLKTLDALHLAVAFAESLTLLTADISLAKAAQFFGVDCNIISE